MSPSFKTSFRVTWVDTDPAQIVHYSNYFRFFERAEEEFYRKLSFSLNEAANKGLLFPRVEAFCQFKKPARLNDLLEVELMVGELKRKSVKYSFKVFNKELGMLLANGYVIIVALDKKTWKATEIPIELAEKLKSFAK